MKNAKKEVKTTATQNKVLESLNTVSSKIRYLDDQGLTRSEIAFKLNKRYQHVRNVLITPITNQKK